MGTKADLALNDVRVDGVPVRPPQRFMVLALHKPEGYLSTREDTHDRPTVMDLIPPELHQVVYPVGRLDLNSSGLLLLTNDGQLANRLIHPRYQVPKRYIVTVSGSPAEAALQRLREGVEIEDGMTAPAEVRALRPSGGRGADPARTVLEFVIREGKKREIRRMCRVVGHDVLKLQRVEFGPIELGELEAGHWRELAPAEVEALRRATETGGAT